MVWYRQVLILLRESALFTEVRLIGAKIRAFIVGPKTLANPQPTRVGKWGSRGRKPLGGGLWGVSPHKTKRGGELPPLATPPRVGPKTLANPKPTRVGKGVEGAQPPPRGLGGCAPKILKKGESS